MSGQFGFQTTDDVLVRQRVRPLTDVELKVIASAEDEEFDLADHPVVPGEQSDE